MNRAEERTQAADRAFRHEGEVMSQALAVLERAGSADDELVVELRGALWAMAGAYTAAKSDASTLALALLNDRPWGRATESRTDDARQRRARAVAYRVQGLSAVQIGRKIAREEGRAEAYTERTVRQWFAIEKGAATGKRRGEATGNRT